MFRCFSTEYSGPLGCIIIKLFYFNAAWKGLYVVYCTIDEQNIFSDDDSLLCFGISKNTGASFLDVMRRPLRWLLSMSSVQHNTKWITYVSFKTIFVTSAPPPPSIPGWCSLIITSYATMTVFSWIKMVFLKHYQYLYSDILTKYKYNFKVF